MKANNNQKNQKRKKETKGRKKEKNRKEGNVIITIDATNYSCLNTPRIRKR